MYNGIINVYKEAGYTSHDVVAKLRGICKQKKIGHTGTLDPEAEGVLPVCLGNATKVCDLLTDRTKTYRALLHLGITTDTQDMTGTILKESSDIPEESRVREVIASFVGSYDQVPPMYSALKVNGKKLYELAREGKTVERKARRVEILSIEILRVELPLVEMDVTCSKGTYIRTLCDDIGNALSCGGCMEHLLRTRVGEFPLEESMTLAQIEQARDEDRLGSLMIPADRLFQEYPAFTVTDLGKHYLDNGNRLGSDLFTELPPNAGSIRVYQPDGTFFAIYEYDEARKDYRSVKIFKETV